MQACAAKVLNTSPDSLFLLFIGKEGTNMAAPSSFGGRIFVVVVVFFPGSTFCADCHFGIRSAPVLLQ